MSPALGIAEVVEARPIGLVGELSLLLVVLLALAAHLNEEVLELRLRLRSRALVVAEDTRLLLGNVGDKISGLLLRLRVNKIALGPDNEDGRLAGLVALDGAEPVGHAFAGLRLGDREADHVEISVAGLDNVLWKALVRIEGTFRQFIEHSGNSSLVSVPKAVRNRGQSNEKQNKEEYT